MLDKQNNLYQGIIEIDLMKQPSPVPLQHSSAVDCSSCRLQALLQVLCPSSLI